MVPRLWVPLIHWLWARNWKLAASGACLTASRVANKVAVSTPLRIGASNLARGVGGVVGGGARGRGVHAVADRVVDLGGGIGGGHRGTPPWRCVDWGWWLLGACRSWGRAGASFRSAGRVERCG